MEIVRQGSGRSLFLKIKLGERSNRQLCFFRGEKNGEYNVAPAVNLFDDWLKTGRIGNFLRLWFGFMCPMFVKWLGIHSMSHKF